MGEGGHAFPSVPTGEDRGPEIKGKEKEKYDGFVDGVVFYLCTWLNIVSYGDLLSYLLCKWYKKREACRVNTA